MNTSGFRYRPRLYLCRRCNLPGWAHVTAGKQLVILCPSCNAIQKLDETLSRSPHFRISEKRYDTPV